MKIYNSLTKKKEDFLLKRKKIKMYTCGVTVYDDCHIGHARSLYIFDVIRRYLEYKYGKNNVNFVRNITDIDDKIIKRANELKIDWRDLVEKYIDSYIKDLELLGIRKGILDADGEEPRATKNIPDMIKHIKGLIDKGYAYVTDSGVYFNVRKFKDYGKLSRQSIEQMLTGVRKESDETKEDPLDFALWKLSKPGEPSWPSPWGKGRPGWHIECSVMSQKFLKSKTLDIHGGGRDLIFPHHENEIAQAEALTNKPFARIWIHHGLLTINGHKMAKSSGNFVTVKDVLRDLPKNNAADILKVFFLKAHYSDPIDFSQESIKETEEAAWDLLAVLEGDSSKSKNKEIDLLRDQFEIAMDDDFNTPQALAAIFGMKYYCNSWLRGKQTSAVQDAIRYARYSIRELGGVLGLSLNKRDSHDPKWGDSSFVIVMKKEEIQYKVNERERLRKEERYAEADKIRKELAKKGVILEDKKDGTTEWYWKR